MTEVAVVGGGLAGLTAARHLARAGVETRLFERRETVGGRVRSRREDGFVFDRGFQVLFTAYPAARRELDYGALDLRAFAPGATIARPGHRSTLADPLGDPGALPATVFNADVGVADLLRLARLRVELARRDPESAFDGDDRSIRAYLGERGFSDRFVRNFAAPFWGGITLDRSLSTSSAVFEYTLGMLTAGRTVVPAGGMGAIPEQLADRARSAGAAVVTDAAVEGLAVDGGGATIDQGGERLAVDAVVVATDPATAGDLAGVTVPAEGRSCVTQYYSLSGGKRLGNGKRLILNAADASPNTVAPLSTVAPEYAPDDAELLSATFLDGEDASDDELAERTRDALSSWFPEHRFDDLEPRHTSRIAFAQFAQPPGFRADLPAPNAPEGPVVLAGDYTRWSSIQGALESGRVAARRVQEHLDDPAE